MLSLLAARLLGLPEAFWAPISTLIIVQAAPDVVLTVAWQRLVGTALGCTSGALIYGWFGSRPLAFGAGVFALGLICAALRLDRAAYRFAGITLTIVMFVTHVQPAWVIAIHRFCEVSLGIVMGVIVITLFPEQPGGEIHCVLKTLRRPSQTRDKKP